MSQQRSGWQKKAVKEVNEARLLSSRSASKPHLDSQATLFLTNCPASLKNHSGWESYILNPATPS